MFKTITIAQRLWLWALLATLLFVLAVGFGAHGLQQARDSLRAINEDNLATLRALIPAPCLGVLPHGEPAASAARHLAAAVAALG